MLDRDVYELMLHRHLGGGGIMTELKTKRRKGEIINRGRSNFRDDGMKREFGFYRQSWRVVTDHWRTTKPQEM